MNSHSKIYTMVVFVLFSICLITNSNAAVVAEYRLDECDFNTGVIDSSGGGNGGAVSGDVIAIQNDNVAGICNNALFDGAGDYINVPNSTSFVNGNEFSASVWFKADTTENWDGIITKLNSVGAQGGSGRGWNININHGLITSLLADSSGHYRYLSSGVSVQAGNWYHVVLVHRSDNTNIIYVNGVDRGHLSREVATGSNLFQIGRFYSNSNGLLFNGSIDEVKLFDTVLGSSEVLNLYTNERAGNNLDGSVRGCQNCAQVPPPVIDYRFDDCTWDGSANEVKDSSNSNAGTTFGGTVINTIDKQICRSALFDGVNDYITVSAGGLNRLLATSSLSFWLKTTQTGNDIAWRAPGIAGSELSGGIDDIFWGYIDSTGHIGVTVGNSVGAKSIVPISDDRFHLIVLTRDASTGIVQTFVDGALSATATLPAGTIGTSFTSIGRVENTDIANSPVYFNGTLDELKVFDRILSADEVEVLHRNENRGNNYDGSQRDCISCIPVPDPIAYYRLDECYLDGSAGEVLDSSTNNNNGVAIANANTTDNDGSGGVCRAGKFDGNGDYIEIADASVLNPVGAFSASVWLRPDSLGRWNGIVSKLTDVNSNTGRGWNLNIQTSNRISSLMADDTGNFVYLNSRTIVQTGIWYFVTLVHQADNTNIIYINGNEEGRNNHAIAFVGNPFQIGKFYTNSANLYFDGAIDEVGYFDEALDAGQVDRLYRANLAKQNYDESERICTSCALAEWRFDECELTTTVADYGGNNFTGTIVNSLDSTVGTICRGGYFEGTNSYVKIDDKDKFDDTSTLTISAWFNAEQIYQDNGTNARGLISKRRTYGNNESFGVFFWNGHGNKLYVDIDNGNNRFASDTNFALDRWYHIDVVYDGTLSLNERVKLYVDGVLDSTHAETSTRIPGYSSDVFIGNLYTGTTTLKVFKGSIDEVRVSSKALGAAEIAAVYSRENAGYNYNGTSRICPCGPDNLKIIHDGFAINCVAEDVSIQALYSNGALVTDYVGAIDLTASTNHGTWILKTGHGVLLDSGTDNGTATYTFHADDNGEVVLQLLDSYDEDVNIGVSNGVISDDDSEGLLDFNPIGYVVNPAPIGTQVSCKPFSFTLTAVGQTVSHPECGVIAEYTGSKAIKFWFDYDTPNTGTIAPTVNGATIASSANTAINQSVNFINGVASVTTIYSDAGKIQISVRDDIGIGDPVAGTGSELVGGLAPFVVRPFGIDLRAAGNPAAQDHNGGVFVKSGTPFTHNQRAVCWQSADDTDNDGVPDGHADNDPLNNVDLSDNQLTPNATVNTALSHSLLHPIAGDAGSLSGATTTMLTNGSGSAANLIYSEVGIIELQALISDYLAGGDDVIGKSGTVGRFIPDHFTVTANSPVFTDSCSGFTYLDQPFNYAPVGAPQLTITAVNANGNTTLNYGGDFWKFSSRLANRQYSNQSGSSATLNTIMDTDNATLAGNGNYDGSGLLNLDDGSNGDTFTYQRLAEESPFDADINMDIPATDLTDTDGVCYDLNADGSCDTFTFNGITGTELRFGRIRLENTHGSELLPLSMPIYAEYFTGNGFTINSLDTCTVPQLLNFAFVKSPNTNGDPLLNPIVNGVGQLTWSDTPYLPGYIDASYDLSLNYSWLQYDWDSDGAFDDNPKARATFGIYEGSKHIIYLRETTWR